MSREYFGGGFAVSPCKYNQCVDCQSKDKCTSCGWNPAVSKYRKEQIAKERSKEFCVRSRSY